MADWKSSQEFLKEFYASPIVNEDTISAKIKRIFLPKSRKASALKELAGDLSGEGRAGDVILDNDMFEMDTEIWKKQEKRRLSVRTRVSLFILLVAIPLTIAVGFYVMDVAAVGTVFEKIFGPRKYYFISLVIIIYSLLPFFMVFEGRKPQVRELVVLATMVALATAGRAAFFMIPSFKPIIAIVIISAIAFGGEAGFLVGAMTMVVSNFLFGQGPWTPWQMFSFGIIGFLAGVIFSKSKKRKGSREAEWFHVLTLCIFGGLATLIIYGFLFFCLFKLKSPLENAFQELRSNKHLKFEYLNQLSKTSSY